MQKNSSKPDKSGLMALAALVLGTCGLSACSDSNAALNEKVAAAEAAAKRAEDAAARAEEAVAAASRPVEAPVTMDEGPQLAPAPMPASNQQPSSQQNQAENRIPQ